MVSSFWHVGINRGMERKGKGKAPRIQPNGRIEFEPIPEPKDERKRHQDPDLEKMTYGEPEEPWNRIRNLHDGDIAFFIESAIANNWEEWGYYVIAYFVVEKVYAFKNGIWTPDPDKLHLDRMKDNAHELRGDTAYSLLVAKKSESKDMRDGPFKMSNRQAPLENVKKALRLEPKKQFRGYWFRRRVEESETDAFLCLLKSSHIT
jgi:hypothetical protein